MLQTLGGVRRRLGSCLRGQGLLWETSVGAGLAGRGATQGPAEGPCGPRFSCSAERSEVRGQPSTWPFTPSKMGRPSEGCL